ncbi:hypothetical protein [Lentzea flava]|uniref:KOW motif-containing protein n=1 Tax=Lentzea flava TaxID=103732 RepID=A0ABQ2UPP8_9PSEU|nr:hypothetical protein [Lentzea flava]MCP2200030.1 hypothetical protein [Lentzea flava]GGU45673.1 hypothetical protein GCM10010178_42640 [Lentzea flava]
MTRYTPGTPVIITSSLFRGFYGVVDSWQEKKQRYIVAIDGGTRLSLLADSITPIPQPKTATTDRAKTERAKAAEAELAAALLLLLLLTAPADKPTKNN